MWISTFIPDLIFFTLYSLRECDGRNKHIEPDSVSHSSSSSHSVSQSHLRFPPVKPAAVNNRNRDRDSLSLFTIGKDSRMSAPPCGNTPLWPPRHTTGPNGGWGYSTRCHMLGRECPEAVLPDRTLYLLTFSHLLIVNELLPLTFSLSGSHYRALLMMIGLHWEPVQREKGTEINDMLYIETSWGMVDPSE